MRNLKLSVTALAVILAAGGSAYGGHNFGRSCVIKGSLIASFEVTT